MPVSNSLGTSVEDAAVCFSDVTQERGLHFAHAPFGAERHFFPAIMSPGAAFLDFDRDGDLDVFLVNGAPLAGINDSDPSIVADGVVPTKGNRLFRQEADGRLSDVTSGSGLDVAVYGMGVAVGDVNNDGFPDIYLSAYGADRLFLNQHNGTFLDATTAAGIDNQRWGASAAFFDFDRDGWLDLFVTNYVDYDPAQPCHSVGGQSDFCNPAKFARTTDRLYRNVSGESTGTEGALASVRFEDVSWSSGIARKAGAGLGVVCADLDNDGWQDIYVANDGHANFLWINQRDGTFRDEAPILGVAYDAAGRGQGSMGIALGDLNTDLLPDIVVTNLEGENNALYLSLPGQGFQESSATARFNGSFPDTGFGVVLFDIDHDGDLDLVVANGRVRRASSAEPAEPTLGSGLFWRAYAERNAILINEGSGRFDEFPGRHDPLVDAIEPSRALVAGDIDNDGDLDLLVTNAGGAARLYRNDAAKSGNWLMVRAIDRRHGGRDEYGAAITVVGRKQNWTRVLSPCSSYLGTHDPRAHFGLGQSGEYDRIEVVWPDGSRESFPGGSAGAIRVVAFGEGKPL